MPDLINFEGIDNQNMRILYFSLMILALIGFITTFIRDQARKNYINTPGSCSKT